MATLTTEYQTIATVRHNFSSTNYVEFYLDAKIGTQSIANNTTEVYTRLRSYVNYTGWSGTSYKFTCDYAPTVEGSGVWQFTTRTITETSTPTPIQHNSDGTKTLTINASAYNGYLRVDKSLSANVTLPTIPRASSVSIPTGTIGYPSTISVNRTSTSFYHTLTYAFGNLTGTIATNVGDSYQWTIPSSFYSQIPNDKLGQGGIYCYTYQNGVQIGEPTFTYFLCYVDELNSRPTLAITSITNDANSQSLTGANNKFINGYSTANINATLTTKNSANVREFRVTNGSQSLTGTTGGTTSTINSSINKITSSAFTFYNKDTRELSYNGVYAYNHGVTFLNYTKPTIAGLNIRRTEQTSEEVILSFNGSYWNDTFGSVSNVNSLKYAIRSKLSSSSTWGNWTSWIDITTSGSNYYISNISLGDDYDTNTSYDFQIKLKDALGNIDSAQEIITNPVTVTVSTPIIEVYDDAVNINGDLLINEGKPFTYSTNETFTGKYWIDGKKIYKRVLNYTITSSSGSIDLNTYYIDTLIDKRHAFIREAQENTDFDNYYNNENDYCRIFWRNATKSLEYRISRDDGAFRIIIKYTKITD